MAPPVSKDVLYAETDARFYPQTGLSPDHKLDPNNPTDKALIPVWNDIYRKVKAEADAGRLVTTYDHPVVAQALFDSAVASKAAAMHVEAAASASDAATAKAHADEATTAQQVSTQKAREAAAVQPPTVDPWAVKDAGEQAAKTPPPANTSASDQIAHAHVASGNAHTHAQEVVAQAAARSPFPLSVLYKEVNARFWRTTNYKPGQRLDMSIPADREMAKVWMGIFQQVQREAETGTLVFTSPELVQAPPPAPPPPGSIRTAPMPPPPVRPMPPAPRPPQPVPPPQSFRPPAPSVMPPMYPRPPMGPPMRTPQQMRPPMHMPGVPMPGGVSMPGGPMPGGAMPGQAGPPSTPDAGAPAPGGADATPTPTPPEEEKKPSILKYLAIGIAVIAGGGLIYYGVTRKPSRPAPRARARVAPKARMPATAPAPRALPSSRLPGVEA